MLRIAYGPLYAHPLPQNHRFPMEKYHLLPEQLIYEGTIQESQLFAPDALSESQILSTHSPDWWQKLKAGTISPKEARLTGFPYSPALVEREISIMGGTWQAARFALQHGVAMNIAGGTHHAFTDRGEGFCLLNDLALTAQLLLENQLASKILIIDLDVHQGNGTAQILGQHKEVFTFSMHGKNNYPHRKEQSHVDVELPDGTGDAAYLQLLDYHLHSIAESFEPDFVLYQCGVDVLATDLLGKLSLTREGCKKRDAMVLQFCKANSIPIAASMGGGYSPKISDIVEAHANTFRLAQEIFF